jgi:Carboxypeptidase regulatory-like domain/Bacterial Ig-like domain (group 2)
MSLLTHTTPIGGHPNRLDQLACFAVAIALISACSGNSATSPAAPSTTTTADVSSVTITQMSATARTYQLAASARFADGSTRDVTSASNWESSNPSLATVTNTGLVTVAGTGDVELRATYQGVAGSFRLVARPAPLVALWGTVREVQPNQHPLAGARVEIVDGDDAGKFAVTDANGNYTFLAVSMGRASLVVTLDGYQTWRLNNLPLPGNTLEDPWLVPVPPRNTSGVSATARCRDGAWSWEVNQEIACKGNNGIAYFVCPGPLCRPDVVAPSNQKI